MARYTATSPLSPPVRLDTGALRVEALVPPGVQTYRAPLGTVREYVAPEELQAPDYVDGLPGLPVLFRDGHHPGTDDGIISVDDLGGARQLGTVLGQRWTDGGQALTMALDAPDAEDIARRYPYVSVGYRADRDARPGTAPDGTPYDVRQVRRRQPNHVVLTHAPRAGYAAAVRLDAEDEPIIPAQPDGESMDEVLKQLAELAAKVDALVAAMATRKDEAEAEVAAEEVPAPRMDSVGDVLALQDAAGRLGVTLDPAATLNAARKVVSGALAKVAPSVRLDSDDDARQAIAAYVATPRPSQAQRIASQSITTPDAGARRPMTA